ncbi:hypothetical protein H2199_005379 [Coniosporium tulheliwenetii]|uniref:Uncharacterized protein n=1 Tax=Coniosporium tulheliwenetii TaxID=3383036 RepID=A0ACC2Z2E1_9PEZI|nr:hypothetical protein H2199_005379 [Cladosporium sp. JES 115]
MADEDNFDIDIYGDDSAQDYQQEQEQEQDANPNGQIQQHDGSYDMQQDSTYDQTPHTNGTPQNYDTSNQDSNVNIKQEEASQTDQTQQIASTGGSARNQLQPPKQAPTQQGVKRKEGADDRPIDNGATTALLVSDLHWWTNEDDVRGWANQSGCEDEVIDVTFNEHKVNGKSKGQVFVELQSPQAATALKHTIESFGQGQQYAKKHTAAFHNPHTNPYRTLPKDVVNRKESSQHSRGSYSGNQGGMQNTYNQGGFNRGGRGGGFNSNNNRGNMGGFNREASNSPWAACKAATEEGQAFGGGPMGGMPQFGNFNRGGMMGGMRGGMGNRGGRGGMGMGPMGNMGMGGMGMGNMGMGGMPMGGMGMGGMGGMGGGFGAGSPGHFNPAFFGQQNRPEDPYSNPHGAKRLRPE